MTLCLSSNCMVHSAASPHLCLTPLIQSYLPHHALLIPDKPQKAQIVQLSCGCHLMKTSNKYRHIRAHHLAVPFGWLCSPQISGHGDGCSQPIIPLAPAPALAGTDALSDASGCWHHSRAGPFQAEQRAEPRSAAPPCSPFPGLAVLTSLFSPAGTALIQQQQPCKGVVTSLPSFSLYLYNTSFSLSINLDHIFLLSHLPLTHLFFNTRHNFSVH